MRPIMMMCAASRGRVIKDTTRGSCWHAAPQHLALPEEGTTKTARPLARPSRYLLVRPRRPHPTHVFARPGLDLGARCRQHARLLQCGAAALRAHQGGNRARPCATCATDTPERKRRTKGEEGQPRPQHLSRFFFSQNPSYPTMTPPTSPLTLHPPGQPPPSNPDAPLLLRIRACLSCRRDAIRA